MSIRRAPRPETRFYTLDKSISEDPRLSWAARGVLIFLLGKPDNWEVSVKHLISQTANAIGKASGRDGVRVVLKELEQAGYLVADYARSEGGAFAGMAYTVHETPVAVSPQTENPAPVTPETDLPAPAQPAPAKPHLISNEDKTRTDTEQKAMSEQVADAFEMFWKSSHKNGSKKKAGELFASLVKRNKEDPVAFAMVLVNDTIARKKAEQFGFDKLHITTYLNQERWNDRIEQQQAAIKPGSINQDFAGKTYTNTPDNQFADFLTDD